ncbi:imidazole glycerol phosphate synthase subunit HisH [Pelagicoccus sp. SDUM812003]|uniref:imidazole glycerol phosphate synthase subunit HisH n=1 Tax=Pelagicoccus sp. SDUM812003 TaxID=3041267 RepID=UPI00280D1EB9|nr:imidazole glycerol phosphate synthase subunit HisH [Pelagicoccus sp. SDUM812003]MDQ8204823.1 imidazole glycerol phosphate synthase subunit HisH [Pelagicoccus sp. SDUM812003]
MSKDIAVINYGMGNLRSVENALLKIGAQPRIVTRPEQVGEASGLILPGVGALRDCVDGLKTAAFDDFIRGWVKEQRPFMGVCLGLQALFEHSEEDDVTGLGVLPGKVVRFKSRPGFKIPHMGWNFAKLQQEGSPYWEELDPETDRFYFVHSYHILPEDPSITLTTTDYDGVFTSSVAVGSLLASQFHPEKSQRNGLQLYANFVASCD